MYIIFVVRYQGFDRNSRHVKAVDVRLKEIRILKMLEMKKSSLPQKIPKLRRRSRQRGKSVKDDIRLSRSKGRKGKKRTREELPEIVLAEEMFFETVEKVGRGWEKKSRKFFLKIHLLFKGKRKIRNGRGPRTEILDVHTKIRYQTI